MFLGIAVLLLNTLVVSSGNAPASQEISQIDSTVIAREVRDPILINGNSDFLEQKEANDWTGTGEPHDPITIADYLIEFSNEGITIRNVDLHWAIINCETGDYDTQYTLSTGIKIINCTNGAIEDSIAHMKETGIFIDESRYISLHYNTVHDCATGVTVSRSKNILLDNNNLGWNDWVGLNMTLTEKCTVTDNSIISVPYYGIQCLYDKSSYIASNIITSTYLEDEYNEFENVGIFNFGSWNLALWNNYIHECAIGLQMRMINGSWVWENLVGNCTEYCIYLGDDSFNVTVVANTIGPTIGTNAYDSGESNHWDDPIDQIGNCWSDYNGTGYYYVSGPAGSIDHFPTYFNSTMPFPITTVDYTTSTDETPTDLTPTDNTTGDDDEEYQPMIMVISVGSSLVILIVGVLIFRSSRGP
jgi:parallel beta-helix repeat protein